MSLDVKAVTAAVDSCIYSSKLRRQLSVLAFVVNDCIDADEVLKGKRLATSTKYAA